MKTGPEVPSAPAPHDREPAQLAGTTSPEILMKPLLTATLLAPLLLAGAAQARPPKVNPPLRVASEITSVVTHERNGHRVRAVAAEQAGVPFIQIERLEPGRRGWVTTDVDRYDNFLVDDRPLDVRSGRIENLTLRRRVVSFDLDVGQRLTCRARLERQDRDELDDRDWDPRFIRCQSRWEDDDAWHPGRPVPVTPPPPIYPPNPGPITSPGGPGHHGPPSHAPPPVYTPAPQWAASPAVINACGQAFIGSNAQACLDTVRAFRFDPLPAIQSCSQHLIGDPPALDCLQRAGNYYFDPSAVIAACDDAMIGNPDVLTCVDAARGARQDPVPTIRACAQASIGDGNTLTCIQRAFR